MLKYHIYAMQIGKFWDRLTWQWSCPCAARPHESTTLAESLIFVTICNNEKSARQQQQVSSWTINHLTPRSCLNCRPIKALLSQEIQMRVRDWALAYEKEAPRSCLTELCGPYEFRTSENPFSKQVLKTNSLANASYQTRFYSVTHHCNLKWRIYMS